MGLLCERSRRTVSRDRTPQSFGKCRSCGKTYLVRTEGEQLRPLGTDGDCVCGNDSFRLLDEADAGDIDDDCGCVGCGKAPTTLSQVEYTTGDEETIPLCADCVSQFRRGGFVKTVSRGKHESD